MAQSKTPVELTNFSKGLITEVNPLTFPPDASVDERNFTLNRNGTRSRRLGIDLEADYVMYPTGNTLTELTSLVDSGVFRWENVADDPDTTLAVVWVGNVLHFHTLAAGSISENTFATALTLSGVSPESKLSLTAVDGRLIVASGAGAIAVVTYANGVMSDTYTRLLVRDFFGAEALYNNTDTAGLTIDLRSANNVQFRPKFKTDTHIYNLRNQTFGSVRRPHREETSSWDAIENFHTAAYYLDDDYKDIIAVDAARKSDFNDKGVLPSNSDVTHYAMAPDADDNPPTDNFYARTLFDIPIGNVEAPRGYFIIDALRRGTSRLSAYKDLMGRHPRTDVVRGLNVDISTLPEDTTPGGASQVEEFAGRVWYAGFSGDIIDGDQHSPRLSSYVLFSTLVGGTSDINKCYQSGDPTSEESPDLVDTDGGYVRVSGAYGIRKLVNLGNGLAVLADNGVWVITGATADSGFTATGYQVSKISEYPLSTDNSVVVVDNSLLYWSDDGIYILSRNETGQFSVKNLTQTTIQTFYEDISSIDKASCFGVFDPFERKVRWVYGGDKELVFDANTAAFTVNSIDSSLAYVRAPIETTSYAIGSITTDIVVSGDPVEVLTDQVVVTKAVRSSGFRSIKYLTFSPNTGETSYTFSSYTDQTYTDWKSVNGTGVDASGYLVSGYLTGGDTQRDKQVPYLTTHFVQTESGFDENFELVNPSSCKIRSQWDWTNSANSNRWGREFQAYRLGRVYMSGTAEFDNGHSIVTTKNKLRGRGKALSLLLSTEAGFDCQVLGWSMLVGVKGNV